MTITTENGSVYTLDLIAKTWRSTSANTRTDHGTFFNLDDPVIGQPLRMTCPPLRSGSARLIITSPITDIVRDASPSGAAASAEEQHERYIDCGPQAWDDRTNADYEEEDD